MGWFPFACRRWGDYRNESLVIRPCRWWNELRFLFDQLPELQKQLVVVGSISLRALLVWKDHSHASLAQERFADQQVMSIEDPVEIKQDNMLQLHLLNAIGTTLSTLVKLSSRYRPGPSHHWGNRDKGNSSCSQTFRLAGVTVSLLFMPRGVQGVYERLLELG